MLYDRPAPMPMKSRLAVFVLALAAAPGGCRQGGGEAAQSPKPAVASTEAAQILSSYYGLDKLPMPILRLCPGKMSLRHNGMPVTFSVQLDGTTVKPEMFAVQTAAGEMVTPRCATLRPADERLENRTVLLAGSFGTPGAPPKSVEVVGELRDVEGRSLKDVRIDTVTPLEDGPSVVLAERFAPDTPGLVGECPPQTKQVVQLVFEGGVTGPGNSKLGQPQRRAVTVTLSDGSTVTPIALADDDPDNFVLACLDTSTKPASVAVKAGHFHDPGDDANPETSTKVVPGNP